MVFKPNYGRDRAERSRAARARSEEKQRKKDEKTALRKAARAATDDKADNTVSVGDQDNAEEGKHEATEPSPLLGAKG